MDNKMEMTDREDLITFSLEHPDDKISDDDVEEFISNLDFSTLVDARSENMFNGCHVNFTGPQLPN